MCDSVSNESVVLFTISRSEGYDGESAGMQAESADAHRFDRHRPFIILAFELPMMKRLHYIQHAPFETPGSILEWSTAAGVTLSSTRLFNGESLPNPDSFDCLIVMGGPMGVHDGAKYRWLKAETSFIEASIKAGKIVVGICLGAQLVADVLGAGVRQNEQKEIGWFPITTTTENRSIPSTGFLPERLTVFHWHGDTFDIPSSSVRIAGSEGCANQGFVYGDRVVGLQFHLEVTPDTLAEMVKNGRHELVPGKYVQDERTIMEDNIHIGQNNKYIFRLLTNLSELG